MRISDWSSDVCASDLAGSEGDKMRILTLSQQGIESRDQRLLSGQVERDEARKFLRVDGADGCQRAQHGRIENQNIKRIPAFRHSACKAADAIPIGQAKRDRKSTRLNSSH